MDIAICGFRRRVVVKGFPYKYSIHFLDMQVKCSGDEKKKTQEYPQPVLTG